MFKALVVLVGLFAANAVSAQTITISDRSVTTTYRPQYPAAVAYYVLSLYGDIITSTPNTNGSQDVGDWLTPVANMSSFQVRAGATTCSGPASGVWLNLGSSRAWSVQPTGPAPQSRSCSVFLEISAVSNPTVILDSATIWLNGWY